MKMRLPFALAFVAVAVLGAAAVMLAASTTLSAGPVPAAGSEMSADSLAGIGAFDSAVPVACVTCRGSLTICTSEGQKCETLPRIHCRCTTCNGILTCRPR